MKTIKTIILSIALLLVGFAVTAQTDKDAVRAAATDYIEGTANGEPDRLWRAFHKDAALYGVNDDGSMRRIPIDQYIGYFKPGQKNDRDGKIVAVDIVNNAANVKIEILSGPWKYTDFLLLLKLEGAWKIINKSYTRVKVK